MKVADIMTKNVIAVDCEESAEVAARMMAYYNVGMLPVRTAAGKVCGVVTDRDLVIRCVASGKTPSETKVKQIMTGKILSVSPDADAAYAAQLMGSRQIRRLPVVEQGKMCGMLSLGDVVRCEENQNCVKEAFGQITSNVKKC